MGVPYAAVAMKHFELPPEPPPPLIVNEPLNEPSPAGVPNEIVRD